MPYYFYLIVNILVSYVIKLFTILSLFFITDYFFTDSATKGCKDCGICILYAANNDFGMWQYAVNNTFLPLKGPMMQRPDIKGKLKLFPAKKPGL